MREKCLPAGPIGGVKNCRHRLVDVDAPICQTVGP